jgi:hypothetical protein
MASKREREVREKRRVDEGHEWEKFVIAVDKVNNFAAAQAVAANTPREHEPGRHFYSNFAFFLESFFVPDNADFTEKTLYIRLIQRMRASGNVKPALADRVIGDLHASIDRG